MKVIATHVGFDNVKLREVGEEFDVPDNYFEKRPGKAWFVPVDPKLAKKYEDRAYEGLVDGAIDPAAQSAARDADIAASPGNRGNSPK